VSANQRTGIQTRQRASGLVVVRRLMRTRGGTVGVQAALLAVLLLLWEYLPQIGNLQNTSHWLDPYFISSPSRIFTKLVDLATGTNGGVLIWPFIWPTVLASLLGTGIGMSLGGLAGLVLSNFAFLSRVLRPFVVAANATPRIALIPIIAILFGATFEAIIVVSVMVVFFVAFFSAYEGGLTVQSHVQQNARLLGAGDWEVLRFVRLPYVLAWTLASLPLGITFAIISVVTAELLTGQQGMGALLQTAAVTGESSLTFSVAIVLAVLGVTVVTLADALKRRVLHWWATS
jgi:NitT/TauT family transport system permease protein